MPFPLPSPEDLTRQQEAFMEFSLRRHAEAKGLTVSPEAIARAVRSPHGMIGAIVRSQVQLLYNGHLHLRWWGDQYFPDTAEIENLLRHSGFWGVNLRGATKALGRVTLAGTAGTAIPLDLELRSPMGAIYRTTQATAIPAGGSILVDVRAVEAGAEGNAAAGMKLALVSPLVGLTEQAAVVDANAIVGGAAEETADELLERLLKRIQEPPHGGAAFDYPVWVQNAFAAAHVKTLPNWGGLGSVGVCVAMGTKAEPRAPTPAEQSAILDYLGRMNTEIHGVRPVTAAVVVVPAVLLDVPMTIRLLPDEIAVRQAVSAAGKAFFAREATIGGRLPRSRLSEAISSARGEYAHDLLVPAANIAPADTQLPVPGVITWAAPE